MSCLMTTWAHLHENIHLTKGGVTRKTWTPRQLHCLLITLLPIHVKGHVSAVKIRDNLSSAAARFLVASLLEEN